VGDGLDAMKYYGEASKIEHGALANEAAITKDGEIIVGKFVDLQRPDYIELMRNQLSTQLGERYAEADDLVCA